jgi:hypothetical protein
MNKDLADNLAAFNKEVDAFAKTLVPQKLVLFQKKLVLEALRRIVMKTPVDTGRARGNWQVTIAEPAEAQIDVKDKDGTAVIAAGMAAIADLPPNMVVWISNNLDYIEALEDGHSGQAPQGMVALTIAELTEMFQVEE